MRPATFARILILPASFALALMIPAQCHAQAEINPDCYSTDDATSEPAVTPTLTARVANHPAAQPQFTGAPQAYARFVQASQPKRSLSSRISGIYAMIVTPSLFIAAHTALVRAHVAASNYWQRFVDFLGHSGRSNVLTADDGRQARRSALS